MKRLTSILIIAIFLISLSSVYAADGDTVWSKIYGNGSDETGYGVATDSQNNIIVTGDGGTIKYSSNGNILWADALLLGYDVAVDSNNNIILTCTSETMKYDPNGNPLWSSQIDFGGEALAVDSNNNIIVTDGVEIMKYDSNGNPLWSSQITFGGEAYGIATDSQNNIVVAGIDDYNDFYTVKYDSNGNIIWEKTFDSGDDDEESSVAIDSFDNVIISGWADDSVNAYASVTVKYSSDGTKVWNIIDNTGGRWSYAVAVDAYNNIFVTGGEYYSGHNYQYLTVKYDSSGKKIWERTYDFSDYYDDAYDVAVDSQNNIIVTGYAYNDSQYEYYTIKYQGVPPRNKSLPIAQIMKILGLYLKE